MLTMFKYAAIGLGVLLLIAVAVVLMADRVHHLFVPRWRRKFGPARGDALETLREAFVTPGSPIKCIEMDWQYGYPHFCVLIASYEPMDDVRRAGGLCHQVRTMAQEIVRRDSRFGSSARKFDGWEGVWFMSDRIEFEEHGKSPYNWWNW